MRILRTLIVAVAIMTATSGAAGQIVDERDGAADLEADATTAGRIRPGETAMGRVGRDQDVDWYAIDLSAGDVVTVRLQGAGGSSSLADPVLEVRDAAGAVRAQNDDAEQSLNSALHFSAPTAATYYLVARGYSGRGDYQLTVIAGEAPIQQAQSYAPPTAPRAPRVVPDAPPAVRRNAEAMVAALTFQGHQSYDAGVRGSFRAGMLQLERFAYYIIGPNEGLDFEAWIAEAQRLDASLRHEGPVTDQIALRALPGIYTPDYPAISANPDLRDGRLVNVEVAARYLARFRALDRVAVDAFYAAASRISSSPPHRGLFTHFLVQQDALFEGNALSNSGVQRELAKIATIPPGALDAWAQATGYPVYEVAFCLARVDAFFPGGVFSADSFNAALPVASALTPERPPY
jgi:hypothetical protein